MSGADVKTPSGVDVNYHKFYAAGIPVVVKSTTDDEFEFEHP